MLNNRHNYGGRRPRAAVALCLVLLVSAAQESVGPAGDVLARQAQAAREPALSAEARGRVRRAIASVGLILVRDGSAPAVSSLKPKGSAIIVRSDGIIATNHHVISPNRTSLLYDEIYFALPTDGMSDASVSKRYRAKAVLINKDYDLALLRIEAEAAGKADAGPLIFPSLELGDSKSVQLLDDLTIIGFPEKGGLTVTISRGVVEGKDVLGNWIKTNARVIHGNSGGAAVDTDGRLIGIPTRVVADNQPIDKNGDGFPDDYRSYGAVGFLRPAHLVGAMLERLNEPQAVKPPARAMPQMVTPEEAVTVQGQVKAAGGKPIAGALVGLLAAGSQTISSESLLTWGGTNAEGQFSLNNPVPPGRYLVKAKAIGYETYTGEVSIGRGASRLVIELRTAASK